MCIASCSTMTFSSVHNYFPPESTDNSIATLPLCPAHNLWPPAPLPPMHPAQPLLPGFPFLRRCIGCAPPAGSPTPSPWFCPECDSGRMRCFVCGAFGSSPEDLSVRKCSLGACGRFYHVSCASRLPLCNVGSGGSFFRCPQHYCATCGKRCGTGQGGEGDGGRGSWVGGMHPASHQLACCCLARACRGDGSRGDGSRGVGSRGVGSSSSRQQW